MAAEPIDRADVVVVGAGMAGLAAAAQAAQMGSRVAVLEKGASPGGTVPLMGGFLWTATDLSTFMQRMTQANPELADLVVSNFESSVAWLADMGIQFGPRNDHFFDWGRGYRMEQGPGQYVDVLTEYIARRGGVIRCKSPAVRLKSDSDGSVCAVSYLDYNGRTTREIGCQAVVIATGGFQANKEMMARYFGRWADQMFLRATEYGTGDGLEMSYKVGARPSRGYHAYYGQLMPAPPTRVLPQDFRLLTQYNSIHMILVNLAGERFVDESIYDSVTAQALTREERALGFLICDARIDEHDRVHPATPTSKLRPTERMNNIVARDGVVIQAPTIESLADELAERGIRRDAFLQTIEQFNRAAATGTSRLLPVPKKGHAHAIDEAPFYAIPVVPGISFTHGGLTVSADMSVLNWEGERISGLYAAGADAGGLFYEQYMGGASSALVFGRTAGRSAATASLKCDRPRLDLKEVPEWEIQA